MTMKRLKRQNNNDVESETVRYSFDFQRKFTMSPMGTFVACLIGFSVVYCVFVVLKEAPHAVLDSPKPNLFNAQLNQKGSENIYANSNSGDVSVDKLLGGLLASGFDDNSCLSRYQAALYRKASPHSPSPYLIAKLRSYETLHKRCGPYTESYNRTVEQLKSGLHAESSECNYVIWISNSGLGNRILTLASTFLYALLTDRVLLVDPGVDMSHLFCEPFPEVSWFRPSDLPINDQLKVLNKNSPHSFGNLLRSKSLDTLQNSTPPSFLYLHLAHDYSLQDKFFFCDEYLPFLQKVPWLVVKSNNYFLPAFFLMESFDKELHNLFPNKESVFHFLGRYLFHPTNAVWGLITRYYRTNLAQADERVGIQVRVFDPEPGPFKHVFDQIIACTVKETLLPEVDKSELMTIPSAIQKSKAVVMTSLSSAYSEQLKDMYWEYPTVTGEVISVYQPSHEGYQKTDKQMHNHRAWAEMYLLSLSDVLVISARSTFGYVAQGLGGLKPWILYRPENRTVPEPACRRAISMEPCFHSPPFYNCKTKKGDDMGALVPHVGHCEDVPWGLKLVDQANE